MELNDSVKRFIGGGVSGCVAKSVVAPLDRTKILLQAHHPYYKNYGVFRCMWEISRREGVMSLWKSNTMMMIRIFPYSSVQFLCFERYRELAFKFFGQHKWVYFLAGSSAGVSAVLVTYPLDMVRARIAFQITGEHLYRNIPNAFMTIYKQEGGLRAYYRGMSASILGMVPYAGVSFFTFNVIKDFCIEFYPNTLARPNVNDPSTLVLHTWVSLLSGGFAGAISQSVSFPLDVARRMQQLSRVLPNSHKYDGLWSTLSTVYREKGIVKGLCRGLSVNYIRLVPQQAVAFTVFEFMKEVLKVRNEIVQ